MKNNYTSSMPPLYRWYALFLVFMMSTWLPVMGQTTRTVCASGCDFTTISAAITASSPGDVVSVSAGTYSENILVNKSLTLLGANSGVKATGTSRGSGESVIDGTGGSSSFVVTVEADNVTIDGFKVEIRNVARDGINTRTGNAISPATTAYRSGITIRNNWVYANLPLRTNAINGIVFGEHTSNAAQSFSAEISNVTIEDNYIDLISTSSNATPSNQSITGARGIVFTNMFRNSGASMTYTGLTVDDNTVFATYNTIIQAQLQTRMVGATFTKNTIGNSRSGVNLPTLINSTFSNNTIQDINPSTDYYSNLTGAYLGIVNSTVANNLFQRIGANALVIAGGRSADATYFPASSNSTVSNNTINYNDVAAATIGTGTVAGILIEPNTTSAATAVNGVLMARISGTTGALAGSITISNNAILDGGFSSSLSRKAISNESNGTTSAANCNWYGAATSPSSSMSGSVAFTPWLNSGTDTAPATLGFQPASGTCLGGLTVTNVTTSTLYATIQAAVNAANAGDIIEAGAATYNETVNISKALTLRGPNYTVAGSGSRSAEAIVTGGFVMNGVSNVTVSGFSVTGSNVAGSRGILLGNTGTVAGPVTLSNNIIENWTTGISLAGGATYPWVSGVTVSGNLIRNNTAGIGSTENVAGLTVSSNTFSGNAEGIGLGPGLTGLTVTGNTFTSTNSSHIADYGSGTMPAYATLFAGNTFGNAAAVSATNGNDYTTQSIYNTISSAVANAAVGATITVAAGTYSENITINKRLTLDGAGSGSNAASNTIITAAAAGISTIVYSAGGSDASNRQVLKDIRVTGASGGTGNNNSGILLSGASMGYFTFDNIVSTGNTGHGLVSNVAPATSTLTDVNITGSTFSNNGSAGIRTASHSVDGFSLTNCAFTSNVGLGLAFNPSDNTTAQIGGITLNTVTFSGNNSTADLYAFRMLGNMSLTNVDFQGSNGSGLFGLYLLGSYVSQTTAPAIGTVTLNDVTVSGTYTSAGISFLGYSNLAGVSMTDVVLNTTVPTADRGHIRLSGVAGTLNLGNTSFGGTTPLDIRLGSNFGASGSIATIQVDATNASFNGILGSAMTSTQLFATEDRIRHAIDGATDATGFVRVKAGNVYVTTNSFASPATAANIQRGIDAASAGDILNINDGTYTAQSLTVGKRLDIRGQGNGTIIQNSGSTAFTYSAAGSGSSSSSRTYLRSVKISGSSKGLYAQDLVNYLTLDGVTFDGNSSYAIHLNNTSGTMNDWALTNCTFNANSDGFRMGMAANINGLSITGTTFSNQVNSAIYIPQQASPAGGCSNVNINGNTFTSNGSSANNQAALYIEKLSNATISGNTMTNNGLNTNPRGMIINIKYGTYSNVSITGNTVVETRGATQTAGYGINVQGRNDATSYNTNPASVSNVSISANDISGFLRGIEVDNAVDWNTTAISNNTINGCTYGILGVVYGTGNTANAGTTMEVHNNSITGATVAITNANPNASTIDADCNWYGSNNANTIASKISGTVTFSPWLTSGTDTDVATGFQPSGTTCGGTAPSISSSVTNVSCFGLANGAINITVSGGLAPYTYAWNGGSTDEDRSGLVAGTYTVTVTDANLSTVSATVTVTQPVAPVSSGAIGGVTQECIAGVAGQREFSLSPPATTATIHTWSWSGSSGVTLTNNGGTTITFNYTTAAIQAGITGTLTVTPSDVCGNNGPSSSVAVEFQAAVPVTPPSISGESKLCPGDAITASIASVDRATSYSWTAPANTSVTSGAGTNVIQLSVAAGYNGGTLSVTASNICGTSPARTKSLVTNLPSTPSAISGLVNGQCNASGVTYSITAVSGATSYSWSVSPIAASISGSTNGTSVSVNWPGSGSTGTISVSSTNACGSSSARSLTVSFVPTRPDPISGIANPACVNSSAAISVNSVTGAATYTWGVTSGTGSGYSIVGAGKNATVTWGGTPASSQAITVRASNSCGNSLTRQATSINVISGGACTRLSSAMAESANLHVYPNPAHEVLNVNFSSGTEQRYQIRITDMSGRAVMVQDGMSDAGINTVQLVPASITTGVYLMQLTIGDKQAVQRIVIE